MKKSIVLTGLFILTAHVLWSQQRWDISLGAGGGNYSGFRASYNHVLPKNISFSLFSTWQFGESKNAPADYDGGWSIFGEDSNTPPSESVFTYGVMGGYTFGWRKIRLNLRGGVAQNNFSIPENFRWVPGDGWFTFGYHMYDTNHYKALGFVAEPRLELLLFKKVGLGISSYNNFNSYQNIFGFGLDVMIGRMR
jgi:hypothetical protein